ncbi:hypothetical protein [Azotobacter salinestris]|uniref:hypothetical protein n=1 Tax=Azotobacter salinestris TaxID=69964 RepID=UPI0032DEBB8E
MKTLVIRALSALSNPDLDTPILPDYDPSLLAVFSGDSLSGLTTAALWESSKGSLGDSANLDILTGTPFSVGTANGRNYLDFNGSASSSYLDSGDIGSVSIPSVSALMAVNFKSGANVNPGNILSLIGLADSQYFYARRLTDGTITVGVNALQQLTSLAVAPIDTWVFVAVVCDGSGSLIVIDDSAISGATGIATVNKIRVGANLGGAIYANMRLAHAEIYSRALSISDLQERRSEIMKNLQ